MNESTTSNELETALAAVLEQVSYLQADESCDMGEGLFGDAQVQSFADCGIITTDAGLVLTLADGTEFQLTIVRSR